MNNYIKLIKNRYFSSTKTTTRIVGGVAIFGVALAMLGGAINLAGGVNPFDQNAFADTFRNNQSVKNCNMYAMAGYSFGGQAYPGLTFKDSDLKGGVAPTSIDQLTYNTTSNYLKRGENFTQVALAPGMTFNVDVLNYNKTDDSDAASSNSRVRLGNAAKLLDINSASGAIKSETITYLMSKVTNSPSYEQKTTDTFLYLNDAKKPTPTGAKYKAGTGSVKVIQPVTIVGDRGVNYEYKDGKTFATVTVALKNNTDQVITQSDLEIVTIVNGKEYKSELALGAKETKTSSQTFDLGDSQMAITTIEESKINVKKSFTEVIVNKYSGNDNQLANDEMTSLNGGFITRHAGAVTGNQIIGYNSKVNATLTIVPYGFGTNKSTVPRPAPKKVDVALTKTTTTPIVKAGQTAEFQLTVKNVGEDVVTGFKLDDQMPATFDMTTLQHEFDANQGTNTSKVITGNNYSSLFEIKNGGLNPGQSFVVTIKIKAKTDTNCKEAVTNTARVAIEGYAKRQEENYKPGYDLEKGCQANDNNCASVQVKFDCYIPKVSIALTKTIVDQKASYKASEDLSFNFKVTNTGEENLNGFSFEDIMPEGIDMTSINGIDNQNGAVTVTDYKVEGKKVIAKFNFGGQNKFAKGSSYEFRINTKVSANTDCQSFVNISRVSIEGFTEGNKKQETPVTDISKTICITSDTNCSSVQFSIECKAPTMDLALNKTIVEPKSDYKEGEVIKYNLAVSKTGKLAVNAVKITDTIPAELDVDSYKVTTPAGYEVKDLKKTTNVDGSATITFAVFKNSMEGVLNITTEVKVKTGAKCKPIVNIARVDVIDTTPANTPVCTALNQGKACTYGAVVETPSTNPNNGYCIVNKTVANKNGIDCVSTCNGANAQGLNADQACVLKVCLANDNNCSTATTNLYCAPAPVEVVIKKETPRTGAGSIALGAGSITLMAIAAYLVLSTKSKKATVSL
jgi:fimbrial isopeptide formation D2 family protein